MENHWEKVVLQKRTQVGEQTKVVIFHEINKVRKKNMTKQKTSLFWSIAKEVACAVSKKGKHPKKGVNRPMKYHKKNNFFHG